MIPTVEFRWLARNLLAPSTPIDERVLQQWWETDGSDPKGEWRDVPVVTEKESSHLRMRPCPFCGSHAAGSEAYSHGLCNVVCGCGARGPDAPTEQEAIELWNARDVGNARGDL